MAAETDAAAWCESGAVGASGRDLHHGEFEREPVPADKSKSYLSFLAIFAGRHTAGTEFCIGPLFIVHGASAIDVLVGLFLGNVLATLCWRYLTAPVAVKMRYTTFYQLERICGRRVLLGYNLFVGVMLSMIAGAMCTVSATAVGDLFDVPMPGLHDWLPTSWAFSLIVMIVAIITGTVAGFGYNQVARFSLVICPFMLAVIVYMGAESLHRFGVGGWSDFWEVAADKVWTGREPEPGFAKYGMWHCICAAWFCDLMLHIGMLDLNILRYGKSADAGWFSGVGMFAGHYLTWIVAGLLYALQLQADPSDTAVKPGPMAKAVAGNYGLLCVLAAGWSTANPTIYEAGLAFQAALGTGSDTHLVTFGVGLLAGVAGLFPAVVMRILELLAYGGLVLMPMGVVLYCDCFVLPRLRLRVEAHEQGLSCWPAVAAWTATTVLMLPLAVSGRLAVFFCPPPGVAIAAAVYVGGSWVRDRYLVALPCEAPLGDDVGVDPEALGDLEGKPDNRGQLASDESTVCASEAAASLSCESGRDRL